LALLPTNFPWWIGGIVFLAVAVRLPLLGGSFWLDEAAQALESVRPWSQQLQIAADFQPPLYHLIVHGFTLFGRAEWWLRLASLLPGVLSVAIISWWLAKKTDQATALTAGLLLATSSLMVFFSQELRPYMLAVFFSLGAFITFDHLISDQHPRRRWLYGSVFFMTAAWLTSYVTLLLAPIFLVYTLVWQPRRWRIALEVLMESFIFWLLWFPGFWPQWQISQQLQRTLPGWSNVVSPPSLKAGLLTAAKFVVGVVPIDWRWQDALLIAIPYGLLAASLAKWWWSWRTKLFGHAHWALAVFVSLLAGFLCAWIATGIVPIMAPKRVLFLLPMLLILVALAARHARWLGKITLVTWLLWNIVGLGRYWTDPATQREDWRSVIKVIETKFAVNDSLVIFAFDEPFAPWRWYQTQSLPTLSTGLAPLSSVDQFQSHWPQSAPIRYVILFDYLRDLTDPHHVIDSALVQNGYNELGTWSYPNLGQVHIYQQRNVFAWAGYE
jgi:uncharacterized membrane protein